jgi:hypothetical protein
VEFNGLPALSNGYIVDGLETNDPLTNLISGLSTNLVLGLNSISEVTVNTLSYSVDQGRYGASQVNYVTKSDTNKFHGNLYELWNGSIFHLDLIPVSRTGPSMISDEGKGEVRMSKSRHTEAEMIGPLKQLEAGRKAEDVAREVGVSKHTIYAWKAKYGGMDVSRGRKRSSCGMRTRGCACWWRTFRRQLLAMKPRLMCRPARAAEKIIKGTCGNMARVLKVAAILSVVESCRRLKLPVRDYLAAVLPGLADLPIQRLPDLTPAAWVAQHS